MTWVVGLLVLNACNAEQAKLAALSATSDASDVPNCTFQNMIMNDGAASYYRCVLDTDSNVKTDIHVWDSGTITISDTVHMPTTYDANSLVTDTCRWSLWPSGAGGGGGVLWTNPETDSANYLIKIHQSSDAYGTGDFTCTYVHI